MQEDACKKQEMFHGTPSKVSKFATEEDVISSMPDNVITNILDRLPIQYAVRTDVLSKNWRFKWTLLTQLVFDDNLQQPYHYYQDLDDQQHKCNGRDISRLLLHLKGPITKFVLNIPDNDDLMDVKDIYHWVLFLSRKEIQDFTLLNKSTLSQLKLPAQLFSCTKLKHLKLQNCYFGLSCSFSGFPNLLSLDLYAVTFGSYTCGEFLARCPLLEILKIRMYGRVGELELNKIAILVKLKIIHLNLVTRDVLTLVAKLSPLPKLQELTLDIDNLMFAGDIVEKFPTTFLCLKTLTLSNVHFGYGITRLFVFKMICGCPNLQSLEITAKYEYVVLPREFSYLDFSSIGQLQLQSVVFGRCIGSDHEVYLIKSLLACSPLLKKIGIGLISSSMVGGADGKFMFANKLLKLYRASPVVEIDLY